MQSSGKTGCPTGTFSLSTMTLGSTLTSTAGNPSTVCHATKYVAFSATKKFILNWTRFISLFSFWLFSGFEVSSLLFKLWWFIELRSDFSESHHGRSSDFFLYLLGPSVEQVGKTRLPLNQRPLILVNGELTCQTPGGKLTTLTLSTHEMVASVHDLKAEELQLALEKNLALGRYKDAWQVCLALDKREDWITLGQTAMRSLDVELGISHRLVHSKFNH